MCTSLATPISHGMPPWTTASATSRPPFATPRKGRAGSRASRSPTLGRNARSRRTSRAARTTLVTGRNGCPCCYTKRITQCAQAAGPRLQRPAARQQALECRLGSHVCKRGAMRKVARHGSLTHVLRTFCCGSGRIWRPAQISRQERRCTGGLGPWCHHIHMAVRSLSHSTRIQAPQSELKAIHLPPVCSRVRAGMVCREERSPM
mmetsp:Transcript_33236/g.73503  ORF Transcript_33236/g.73503 Transcript_33236/m.73503 type:complete len:205 (+) Transcript_33236:815-1429(+)